MNIHDFYKWDKRLLEEIREVIGKPYKYNCFDLTSFDCYTLTYHLYSLINIQLPKENIGTYSLKVHKKLIKKNQLMFEVVHYNERQPFDILLFESTENIDAHLGVLLDLTHFIHVNLDHSVRIERLTNNIITAQIKKVYRWKS